MNFFFQTIAMRTCALYWIYNCFSTPCGNNNITSPLDLAKQRPHLVVCYLIGIVFCTLNELPDGSVLRFSVGKQKVEFVLFYVWYGWENSDYLVEVIQNSGPNEKTKRKNIMCVGFYIYFVIFEKNIHNVLSREIRQKISLSCFIDGISWAPLN